MADPDSLRRIRLLVDLLGARLVLAHLEEWGSQVPAGAQRMDPDCPAVHLVHASHLLCDVLFLYSAGHSDLLRRLWGWNLPVPQAPATGCNGTDCLGRVRRE